MSTFNFRLRHRHAAKLSSFFGRSYSRPSLKTVLEIERSVTLGSRTLAVYNGNKNLWPPYHRRGIFHAFPRQLPFSLLRGAMSNSSSTIAPDFLQQYDDTTDAIRGFLRDDGHKIWGMVIYRCTYGSNADWEECLRRIRKWAFSSFRPGCGSDLLERLRLTVFEDRSKFDGASTAAIREHFKQWAENAPQEEQGTGPGDSHRYRYCVYVDDEALKSVIESNPKSLDDGYVKLIWKDWVPNEDDDGSYEPLEGCTKFDVGWLMVGYQDIMVWMYPPLRESYSWETEYARPGPGGFVRRG